MHRSRAKFPFGVYDAMEKPISAIRWTRVTRAVSRSRFSSPIHARNKLNHSLHVARDMAAGLILIRDRKAGGRASHYADVTCDTRRAAGWLCILAQPFLDYEPYLLPIIQRRPYYPRARGEMHRSLIPFYVPLSRGEALLLRSPFQ